jgi:hypothetical protein
MLNIAAAFVDYSKNNDLLVRDVRTGEICRGAAVRFNETVTASGTERLWRGG